MQTPPYLLDREYRSVFVTSRERARLLAFLRGRGVEADARPLDAIVFGRAQDLDAVESLLREWVPPART